MNTLIVILPYCNKNRNKVSILIVVSIYGTAALKRLSKLPIFVPPAGVSSLLLRLRKAGEAVLTLLTLRLASLLTELLSLTLLLLLVLPGFSGADLFVRRRSLKEEAAD